MISRLNFEPNGHIDTNDAFSFENRENKCVKCGPEESLCSHHVVPKVYRRWFPNEYKDRNSHDIVVMCRDCHSDYENQALKAAEPESLYLSKPEIEKKIRDMRKLMEKAAKELDFMQAAKLRDEIKALQVKL